MGFQMFLWQERKLNGCQFDDYFVTPLLVKGYIETGKRSELRYTPIWHMRRARMTFVKEAS